MVRFWIDRPIIAQSKYFVDENLSIAYNYSKKDFKLTKVFLGQISCYYFLVKTIDKSSDWYINFAARLKTWDVKVFVNPDTKYK